MSRHRRVICSSICLLIVIKSVGVSASGTCRVAPSAQHNYCGLPFELSNFQGYYQCDPAVKVGRPSTLDDVQTLVTMFPKVRGVGTGSSWYKEMFCAGSDDKSIDIVMTEIQQTLSFIQNPVNPSTFQSSGIPHDFPIQVDEDAETVTVAAGIPQRLLLDYLSDYRYWKSSQGWTLAAKSWYIDQSIGGAASTGTHGSSMQHGSISSQLRAMKLILANGTIVTLTPETTPHLWRAAGVSVGRLGIVAEITLGIVPQKAVTRSLQELDFDTLVNQIKKVQSDYTTAKASGDQNGQRIALAQIDETNVFWHYALRRMWRVDFQYLDKEPLAVLLNIDPTATNPTVNAMDGPPPSSVFNQAQLRSTPPNNRLTTNPRFWANFYATVMRQFVTPGTFESNKAYLSFSDYGTRTTSELAPYRQLEVAVPIDIAGDCLAEIGNEMYGPDALWEGFRTPALIRFVTGEEYYISPTNGGPRMYVNMEDYISLTTGKPNVQFDRVAELFISRCNARLHWGKHGFPQYMPCFDGSKLYPDTWCDFGCAVNELDPAGKFSSQATVWRFNATSRSSGQQVNFASCCTPQGFNYVACQCAPSPGCS